jgi:D-sedoheptulose 7-phosphate isomerase
MEGLMVVETGSRIEIAVRERIAESIAIKQGLFAEVAGCVAAAEGLIAAIRAGGKVLLFGNGGSAADAQHLAAEFVSRFYLERRALPALALTVDTSVLTAIGNDYTFDRVFARQIEALGQPGDVAIGLSTSGNSANVIAALQTARSRQMLTIALTGQSGGSLAGLVDHCIRVPSADTPRIQEAHILIGHILCELVERACCEAPDAWA